jgi:hypothetical protein
MKLEACEGKLPVPLQFATRRPACVDHGHETGTKILPEN